MKNKFWSERLERDIKKLKKSAWNILYILILKYGFKSEINIRGFSTIDVALQIINNKKMFSKLSNDEKEYVSGLLGKTNK